MEETSPRPVRLFDSFGIVPRIVRFFLFEKHVEIPRYEVDLLLGENRDEEYLKLNPSGQTPALELSGGTIICEGPVICEFVEELFPASPLIGATPEQRAITRMWWRRMELNICQPMILGFYYSEGLQTYRTRMRCIPEAADGMKERGRDGMRWVEELLSGAWICGNSFTIADIHLYAFLDEMSEKGQTIPDDCLALKAWFKRVASRPAAGMSRWRWHSADRPEAERPKVST
jgi:glutathione S-transferase